MKLSGSVRFLLNLIFWVPLLLGIAFFVYAAVPHLWFVNDGAAHETMSLFRLVGNTWKNCGEAVSSSVSQTVFCFVMRAAVILFWGMLSFYFVVTLMGAFCSLIAFSYDPYSGSANRAKKVLYLLCPNRVCWCIVLCLPLLCGLFPQLLMLMYRACLSFQPRMYASPMADWAAALIVAVLSVGSFFGTIRLQEKTKLNLFCLYRKRKEGDRG